MRGSLIRTYLTANRLRPFAKPCDTDGGACPGLDDLAAKRALVAERLDEAKAFATSHPDALPVETQCLSGLIEQADRLASAVKSHRAEAPEREELGQRLDRCKESFALTPSPTQSTHIPPTELQKIVRTNFGRFKLCYTAALRRDPATSGRVEPDFIIDKDGTVADVRMRATTIADQEMNDCILRTMLQLRFPPPGDGYVNVVYPLLFSPGDQSSPQ